MRQRWIGIYLVLVLALAAAGVQAQQPSGNTNSSDNRPWNRRLDDARVDQIRLQTDRFDTVTQLMVITPDCAFGSDTRNIMRRGLRL